MLARLLGSRWLVLVAGVVVAVLFWFRPGGVTGPRVAAIPAEGKGFDYQALTQVLQAVVRDDGSIDYGALRRTPGPLNRVLGQLRATSPASAPHRFKMGEERLAYYLNAYNAFVLAAVRDRCPLESVRDAYLASGFFWRISFLMGEEPITLQTLEGELIRALQRPGEPEPHLVISRAARGGPHLERTAFEPGDLRQRLAKAGARIARDPRLVSRDGEVVRVSELFRWYERDFGGDVLRWLGQRNPALVEGSPRVEYVPFDWSLDGTCGG